VRQDPALVPEKTERLKRLGKAVGNYKTMMEQSLKLLKKEGSILEKFYQRDLDKTNKRSDGLFHYENEELK
jgi:hypothetical protein